MNILSNNSAVKTDSRFNEINILPLINVLLSKVLIIILAAVIAGAAFFGVSKFVVTPTYRASFTAYVNNRSQLKNDYEMLTSSDLTAAQALVRAYSKIIKSDTVLNASAKTINLDASAVNISNMVTTEVENETEIIRVYVVADSPEGAYNLARAIANVAPNEIAEIIEGSSMRIIDYPVMPTTIYKPSYVKNTAIGMIVGIVIAVAVIVIKFLSDDRVKNENELEEKFSIPVVGVIPDMSMASKGGSNYYDYEYAYRYSNIKRSGDSDGKK